MFQKGDEFDDDSNEPLVKEQVLHKHLLTFDKNGGTADLQAIKEVA